MNKEINTETIYTEYLDALMKILNDFDNISFILSNDKALEFVERLETLGYKFNEYDTFSFKEFEELYNTDILLISKSYWNGKEHYELESAYDINDNLKTIEGQDVVFVEDELIDSDELREYIDCPIVTLGESEYSEDDEELENLFEELTQEVIEAINDNMDDRDFCPHCAIKDAIIEAYEIGLHDGLYGEE